MRVKKSKLKTKTVKVGNYVVLENGESITVNDANYNWKLSITSHMQQYHMLKYMLDENKLEELEELLATVYYSSMSVLTDTELVLTIQNYFEKKLAQKANPVTEESEKENLKIVKDETEPSSR